VSFAYAKRPVSLAGATRGPCQITCPCSPTSNRLSVVRHHSSKIPSSRLADFTHPETAAQRPARLRRKPDLDIDSPTQGKHPPIAFEQARAVIDGRGTPRFNCAITRLSGDDYPDREQQLVGWRLGSTSDFRVPLQGDSLNTEN
jgi:hypothetical protein